MTELNGDQRFGLNVVLDELLFLSQDDAEAVLREALRVLPDQRRELDAEDEVDG